VTGSPNDVSLDLADTLRMRLAEISRPASRHVETELQQLAASRSDNAVAAASKRRFLRDRVHRKEPAAGAFDSPESFVFVADA
jgi:hypothetical protein